MILGSKTLTEITESIKRAISFLEQQEPIAFPTETVYGIGACFNSINAVNKIYQLKNRPRDNPLIIHLAEKNDFFDLVDQDLPTRKKDYLELLVQAFFPGPLTLVVKRNPKFGWEQEIFRLKTIALRMPSLKITQELIKAAQSPLVAASANLSGKPSGTKYEHVQADFSSKIKCILRDPQNKNNFGLESTVLDCQSEKPRLLRAGSLRVEEINRILKKSFSNLEVDTENYLGNLTIKKTKILSPGTKYKHYAPLAKVKIIDFKEESDQFLGKKLSFLGSEGTLTKLGTKFDFQKIQVTNSLESYAQNLFSFFRESDSEQIDFIFCQRPPRSELGLAIYERLLKASSTDQDL